MIINITSAAGDLVQVDLEEMLAISLEELSELNHQVLNNKDYQAAIKMLRLALRKNIQDLHCFTDNLLCSHFALSHWRECKLANTMPVIDLVLPFNYYCSSQADLKKLEQSNATKLWHKIVHSFREINEYPGGPTLRNVGENIIVLLTDLKYLTGALTPSSQLQLKRYTDYLRDNEISEKFASASIKWLEEKMNFESTFIRDYFSEVDFKSFDKDALDVLEDYSIKKLGYPENFYRQALESLNL